MKQLERELGSITYAESQTRTLQLPRNYAYRALTFKLVCSMTRAVGTAGTSKDSCPSQLVKNITIRANGRDTIKSIDYETMHRLTELRHGVRPLISAAAFTGYAVKTSTVMSVFAQMDFAMPQSIRPIDTLLDSAGLATLELIVTFGAPNDVMNTAYNGTGCGVDSATLYVASLESVGVPADTQFLVNKEYMIRSQVTAASTSHQINLPVSNLYRSFVLKTHSDGNQVNTILNNITIKAGTEVFKNRIAGFLQGDNRVLTGIQVPEVAASGAAIDHYCLEHPLGGYYLLEFCPDGHLTEALDTSKLSSLELVLDVNHPGTNDFIDIFPIELILPATKAA